MTKNILKDEEKKFYFFILFFLFLFFITIFEQIINEHQIKIVLNIKCFKPFFKLSCESTAGGKEKQKQNKFLHRNKSNKRSKAKKCNFAPCILQPDK